MKMAEKVEVYVDVIIGAITTTGSVLAFLKLRGSVSGRPHLAMLTGIVVLGVMYGQRSETWKLLAASGIAGVLGMHLVAAIGGADMPVVVSMLNRHSGWTAAPAGFICTTIC